MENPISQSKPTSEERLMAALSHFLGWWVALIVWLVEKDKSRYVRFQAMQALAFSLTVFVLSMIASLLLGVLMFAGVMIAVLFAASALEYGSSSGGEAIIMLFSLIPSFGWMLLMPFYGIIWLARLIATISTASGNDFRYPLIGKWVANFLKD